MPMARLSQDGTSTVSAGTPTDLVAQVGAPHKVSKHAYDMPFLRWHLYNVTMHTYSSAAPEDVAGFLDGMASKRKDITARAHNTGDVADS